MRGLIKIKKREAKPVIVNFDDVVVSTVVKIQIHMPRIVLWQIHPVGLPKEFSL